MNLTLTPAYVFYDKFDENNGWRLPVSLGARWEVTKRTRLDFTDNFLYTEDPVPNRQADPQESDQSPSDVDTTERRGRQPYLTNRARLRITHQFGRRDQVYIQFFNRLRRNDDDDIPVTDREDSTGYSPSAGLTFWMTPQWGLGFEGRFTRGYFEQPDNFVGIPTSDFDQWYGRARLIRKFSRNLDGYLQYAHTYQDFDVDLDVDYQIYEPSIGVDYFIDEDIELRVNVGYYFRDFKNPELEDDDTSDIDGRADLIKTLKKGSYRLFVSGGYDYSYFGNDNRGFTRYGMAGYGVNYFLLKRFRIDSFAYYRRNEFLDNLVRRDENIFRFTTGLSYIPLQWMSIRLAYTYNRRDSNISINDYTENRGLLTVSFSPEQPYRILQ
jgi:hypothetical protein